MPLVGEDRRRTKRDKSRDRPGDEMVRITVAEAAHRLAISEAGVRKRVQRGQIPYERDDAGRLFVWVSPGETRHAESQDEAEQSRDSATALVEEMRDRLRYVEGQLEAERQAHAEARRLLLEALTKIPAAIEPSEPRETPEGPGPSETPTEGSGGRETPSERPWWRRIFGA